MSRRGSLGSDLVELLHVHRAISGRWHFDEVPKQARDGERGAARLSHGSYLELGNLLTIALVTELLGYAGTEWTFLLLEGRLVQRRIEVVYFDPGRSIMKLGHDGHASRPARCIEIKLT